MRYRLAFLLPALLLGVALLAFGLEKSEVAVDHRDGTYFANLALNIAAPPEVVLAVLTDFARMPDFMPGMISSRVLAHEGNIYRVAQRGKVGMGPFSLSYESERRIEVVDASRVVSQALSGTARRQVSETRLLAQGKGTRLEYHIEMVPATWLPSMIGSSFFSRQLAAQFSALEREVLRRHAASQPVLPPAAVNP